MAGRQITYTEAAREALTVAMELDPTIFVLGEGIGVRGGNFNTTLGLYARFGERRSVSVDSSACVREPP